MENKILIIGAGPTGLGAAYHLKELGYKNWQIFERNDYVGGLSASFKDSKGFTWDIGGHVLFSHYEYFDRLLDNILGKNYIEHKRKAFIWIMNRWVPYPFQNNIRYLPRDKIFHCLLGLLKEKVKKSNPKNFKEWIFSKFGYGIAKYFMLPHNYKIWSHPLEKMSYNWIAERISIIDIKRILRNIIFRYDDTGWGPNSWFKFPSFGGTGEIFRRFIPYIKDHLFLKKEVVKINTENKEIIFSDGDRRNYDILINTIPLDEFIRKADLTRFLSVVEELKHNSVVVVGIGIKKPCPSDKCWMYFPENNCPFYRVTYFSNYSPHNTPQGDYYSLMCEIAYSKYKPVNKDKIIDETIQGLINAKMLSEEDRKFIVSVNLIDAKYAYPVPTLDRDKALACIQPYLEQINIYSRGRFGAWRYEIGNMDHCVMQGKEVVDKVLEVK
ncbi:MAG: amine oxidase [Candidatus Omnitrophota bacterium]|nr:MAG: amine oxidase [Candidatus Omnitrophota bacterium]RKY38883.1 MAG: amine oxidase [Candidatus Omnitrophota bacterium]